MIRKVLMATINHDHPQLGMEAAFRGIFGRANVETFDYCQMQREGVPLPAINQMFHDLALRQQPDWIWLQVQETNCLQSQILDTIHKKLPGIRITHWTGDMRRSVSDYLASICASTDVTFASSKGQLPAFELAGASKAHYLQIGVDFEEDVLGLPYWEPDFQVPAVVLCGNYYGGIFPGTKQREDAIQALVQAGIPIGIIGSGWPEKWPVVGRCSVKQQHHVYRKAKVALNVNHFNEIEGYYSDRQLIAMASGTPTVCWRVPGLDKEFVDRTHCLMADTSEEFVGDVDGLLKNPEFARDLGRQGRAKIIREHTWYSRIMEALAILEAL